MGLGTHLAPPHPVVIFPSRGSSAATLPIALRLAQSGELVELQPIERGLGERAFGRGRWTCALTEASQSDVRSLIHAPLGLSLRRGLTVPGAED